MKMTLFATAALALAIASPSAAAGRPTVIHGTGTSSKTLYASGLNNPRELKFGPDGMLYVAEGGTGGTDQTAGQCPQVPTPPGPYSASPTGGRISRIDSNGHRTTVTDRFPSSQSSEGGDASGVADIAFIGNTLYALTAGGGCSHGEANTVNGIFRIASDGTPVMVANLSHYQMTHPVAHPNPGDFEPDGTWYSMVAVRGALYAVEPNHGEVDKITPGGSISRVADISATQGHIVPTAIATHGVFYLGNLNTYPITPGSSKILQLTPSGAVSTVATGLTMITGLTFDDRGRMYVLENTTTAGFPNPGTGEIVRVSPGGAKDVVADGLNLPGGLTYGPDGALYVTTWAFGGGPGAGEVWRVRIDD